MFPLEGMSLQGSFHLYSHSHFCTNRDECVNTKHRTDHLTRRAGNACPLLQMCPHGSCCCQCVMPTETPEIHPVASRWGGRCGGGGGQLQLQLKYPVVPARVSTDQRQTEPLICSPAHHLYVLDLLMYRFIRKSQMVNKHRADLITVLLNHQSAFQK